MTQVFLVRHGQASAGTDNYDRLSEIGQEQSRLLGVFWNQSEFHIDAAFAGSLQRQQHTAELALAGRQDSPKVQTLDGLNEYDHNVVDRLYGEGVESDIGIDLQFDQYVEIMQRWRDAPAHPNTLSWQQFSEQGWNTVCQAVDEHGRINGKTSAAGDHANLVFFTSGGVIATIVSHVLSADFNATMHALWQTRNASVTQLLFNRHGVCMVDYNTVAHLHVAGQIDLLTQI